MPPLTDADAPPDDGYRDTGPPAPEGYIEEGGRGDPLEDDFAFRGTVPSWPSVPAWVPAVSGGSAAGGRAARAGAGDRSAGGDPAEDDSGLGRPAGGLLDLTLPWATLTAEKSDPGALGRIGPVTASQARYLAGRSAVGDHAATWRVIVTDDAGRATGVARMPRLDLAGDPAPEPPCYAAGLAMTGLVGRVTVVIRASEVASMRDWETDAGGILAAVLATARRADSRARRIAEADRGAPGGCAHLAASRAYRPPSRIREDVIARDVTCRYPFCGQPAWRGDLDHTKPWHRGGRTCSCNLGGLCRAHHILKQHLGWTLTQLRPGTFQWTTPAGLVYTVQPDIQPS